jgi:hypothetical protein
MGFSFDDVVAMFSTQPKAVHGIDFTKEGGFLNFLKSISKTRFNHMTPKQKGYLEKIHISLWDIIKVQSGGHKDITNVQGFAFAGKGYVDTFMKPIMLDIAKEMKERKLQ